MANNAANLLADILESWNVPANKITQEVRGFEDITDLQAWREQTTAVQHVASVDQTLTGMTAAGENVSMFMRTLPRWYAGAHLAATPWDSKTNSFRRTCTEGDIDLLRALGSLIDAHPRMPLGEDARRRLADILDQANELLAEDLPGLPSDARRYLCALLERARLVLNNLDEYGYETLRQVVLEMGGAFTAQAERSHGAGQPEKAQRWWAVAFAAVTGFFGGTGSEAGRAIAAEGFKQITKGG